MNEMDKMDEMDEMDEMDKMDKMDEMDEMDEMCLSPHRPSACTAILTSVQCAVNSHV